MEPSIKDGRFYFVNRISSYLRQHQIGDIIIFEHKKKLGYLVS
ncbi:MAG: S26 family signal peptidase [Verrucomicrobia bacterium]|nr:S26 family signal peptidase [Verrucomicrobiota bacterium]